MPDRCCSHCAELRRRVEALERANDAMSPRDRESLERVLPAIGGTLGSAWFKSAEAAATPAVQVVLRGASSTRLGQLLALAVGQPIAGFVVERSDGAGHARLWRLLEVAPQRPSSHRRAAPLA